MYAIVPPRQAVGTQEATAWPIMLASLYSSAAQINTYASHTLNTFNVGDLVTNASTAAVAVFDISGLDLTTTNFTLSMIPTGLNFITPTGVNPVVFLGNNDPTVQLDKVYNLTLESSYLALDPLMITQIILNSGFSLVLQGSTLTPGNWHYLTVVFFSMNPLPPFQFPYTNGNFFADQFIFDPSSVKLIIPLNTLTVTRTGNGTVKAEDVALVFNAGGVTGKAYISGATSHLSAIADQCNSFDGWGGAHTRNLSSIELTMNQDWAVTASFSLNLPVYNATSRIDYSTLAALSPNISNGDDIKLQSGRLDEKLTINNAGLAIGGGYDCDYGTQTDYTTINELEIQNGDGAVDRLIVQ
jgi:hypothetical protein